nr:UMP-CMP kinase 4-like isoform X2 [Oryza sativa Japonica Group]
MFSLNHGGILVAMSTAMDDPDVLTEKKDINENMLGGKKVKIIFVLGGPGSGKGTQCSNIVEHFGFIHLSAGELLRAEINSGSENGTMIDTIITEGKIVPSEITIKLLQEAIIKGGNDKYIIDGFPRNEENRVVFESVTLVTYFQLLQISISPEFVLFFDCSEEEMERRLLGRNQGRSDDNIETIRKRLKVFVESSLPVIEYYESKGMVKKVCTFVMVMHASCSTVYSPYRIYRLVII